MTGVGGTGITGSAGLIGSAGVGAKEDGVAGLGSGAMGCGALAGIGWVGIKFGAAGESAGSGSTTISVGTEL